jgi:hypothetical protein
MIRERLFSRQGLMTRERLFSRQGLMTRERLFSRQGLMTRERLVDSLPSRGGRTFFSLAPSFWRTYG